MIQKLNKNRILLLIVFASFILSGSFLWRSTHVFAGQFQGSVDCRTGAATSTLSFMTRGTGTTTLSCDVRKVDSIRIYIILAASSTDTRYRFRVEDSPNNNDWYARLQPLGELASTTNFASNFGEDRLRFASSTDGMQGGTSQDVAWSGTGTTTSAFVSFAIPKIDSDYIRVVFYLDNSVSGATTTNGAIRAEGVTKETRASFAR